jgi:hypothetical protein
MSGNIVSVKRYHLPKHNHKYLVSEIRTWVKQQNGRIFVFDSSHKRISLEIAPPGIIPLWLAGRGGFIKMHYEDLVLYVYIPKEPFPTMFQDVHEAVIMPYVKQYGGYPLDETPHLLDMDLRTWTEQNITGQGMHQTFVKALKREGDGSTTPLLGAYSPTGPKLASVHLDTRARDDLHKQISHAKFETPKHELQSNIFICYRRADSNHISGRIYDHLSQHFGKDAIFKDVDSVPLGVDFRSFINEVIGKCQVLLAVIGDQWLSITNSEGKRRIDEPRDYVRLEIESALKRNIPVIPLLVGKATIPTEDDLPAGLKELAFRNGIQIRPDPDFHNDMNRLIKSLEIHLRKVSKRDAT